jgi:hypothetical protein
MANTRVTTPVTDFDKTNTTQGLKLPSGTNSNQPAGVNAIQGMLRNNTEETVNSSASALTHYNGTEWKYFTASVSSLSYSIEFLVVAGGGGAGNTVSYGYYGGGGGAGGYLTGTTTTDPGLILDADIGTAGSNTSIGNPGTDGGDSILTLDSIIQAQATGGGGGGGNDDPGTNGGSGGGAGGNDTTNNGGSTVAGTGAAIDTTVQGYAGGNHIGGYQIGAGGGGGAGGPGGSPINVNGGDGGATQNNSITGTSTPYAGGGAGGHGFLDGSTEQDGNAPAGAGPNTGFGGSVFETSGDTGVIILKIPSSNYSGTVTGSPIVDTSSVTGYTILKFAGDGTYTT